MVSRPVGDEEYDVVIVGFGDETYPFNRTHYKWKQHGHYVDTLHAWVMPVHMVSDPYQNGTYLTEAMISGRSAGLNAVRRTKA